MLIAVGQFQRDLQNELTAEGIVAAEAEGRYRGRPPALSGDLAEDARSAYRDRGASIAALARAHGASRAAVRTALAGLLPNGVRDRPGPPGSPAPLRVPDRAQVWSSALSLVTRSTTGVGPGIPAAPHDYADALAQSPVPVCSTTVPVPARVCTAASSRAPRAAWEAGHAAVTKSVTAA